MQGLDKTKILFIAGFGPIVRDTDASRKLYVKALEIPFKEESGGYLHTDALQGAREFALWPLSQAAESCFGNSTWPDSCRRLTPGSSSMWIVSREPRRSLNPWGIECLLRTRRSHGVRP